MAETASNLARLDGMNYGERMTAETLKESYAATRSVNFTEETKRRIVGGNQVLSYGHSEEIYLKARTLRDRIVSSFGRDFGEIDIILSPMTPGTPPKIGSSMQNPLEMYLSDVYTVGFSLGGLPTLSAPAVTATGIQIGCQCISQEERDMDNLAKISAESVIMVTGQIIYRSEDDYNTGLRTGTIELDTKELEVLNPAKPLPFEIRRASKSAESIRFKYKYLDLRNDVVRKTIINRHKVIKLIRDTLDQKNFIEIETPILSSGTDEGYY